MSRLGALPTFLIVGVQKAGTSTLHVMVGRHPRVLTSRPKEVHYFDRHFDEGVDWYTSHFEPKRRHRAWGESTPYYMYDPVIRERMHALLPEVALVAILRDPAARAYSHYWMNRQNQREELDTFEAALAAEPERLVRVRDDPRARARCSYLDRGHYADQLAALDALYGEDRVHVLLLDDLVAEPAQALAGVFRHLGVDPAEARDVVPVQRNSAESRRGRHHSTRPSMSYPPMDPGTRRRLVEHFAESNARLARRLGRDLSTWSAA